MIALALSFVIALAAFLSIALAMDRHQRDLVGHALSARWSRPFRAAGWLLLAASAAPMISRWDVGVGLSLWGALVSLAAIALVLAIAVRARSANPGRPSAVRRPPAP